MDFQPRHTPKSDQQKKGYPASRPPKARLLCIRLFETKRPPSPLFHLPTLPPTLSATLSDLSWSDLLCARERTLFCVCGDTLRVTRSPLLHIAHLFGRGVD